MVRIVLHIIIATCLVNHLSGQSIDYPVDLTLLKDAEVVNFSAVNSENLEFSPTLYNDGIIYVASRPRSKNKKKKNNKITFDLKYYDLKKQAGATDFYEKDINDLHHFGPCAFNPIGKEIFYSENYKDKKGADDRYHMKLVRAVFSNDNWKIIDDFPFNSHEYSIFHPAISQDGSTMVFASNMPGGYGKMDLYSITKTNSGWTLPENLGPEVNSESNDWFPTFYDNAHLFYSSDSKKGLGGLDIFVCKFIDGGWRFPQNLGKPINSTSDDIGFALSIDATYGFFSSNRVGGNGEDDIYKFELPKPMVFDDLEVLALSQSVVEDAEPIIEAKPKEMKNFQYLVLDKTTNRAIQNAEISFTPMLSEEQILDTEFKKKYLRKDNKSGKLKLLSTPNPSLLANKESTLSDISGKANINLVKGQLYLVEIQKEGFDNERSIIDVSEMMNQSAMFINMDRKKVKPPIKEPKIIVSNTRQPKRVDTNNPNTENTTNAKPTLKVPTIIGELLVFENLLYDYNEATIKKGGTKELQELADYMKKYPQLEVELSAHTDAIGSGLFNLNLSQKRAEFAKKFLVDNGVDANRIVAKGYGEQVIRNHCLEGVICTDDEHAYNRRTELKITKN